MSRNGTVNGIYRFEKEVQTVICGIILHLGTFQKTVEYR